MEEKLEKVWDLGWQAHKLSLVQGNRVDPIGFRKKAVDEAMKALTTHEEAIVREVIGRDEKHGSGGNLSYEVGVDWRNMLRQTQRERAESILREHDV